MRDFLSSLRAMFLSSLSDWDLGIVAREHIRNVILPSLEKLQGKMDEGKLVQLTSEYEAYLDKSFPRSKIFGTCLRTQLESTVRGMGLDSGDIDDFEQRILMRFYQPVSMAGKQILNQVLARFNPLHGVKSFEGLWYETTRRAIQYEVRNLMKEPKYYPREEIDLDEIAALQSINWKHSEQIIKELPMYVKTRLRNPKKQEMFDLWFEAAQTKGANHVNMQLDVYEFLRDRGYTGNNSAMTEMWVHEVKPLIYKFFKDVLDMSPLVVKRFVGSSIIEAVTYYEYRRRMAMWVLCLS